MPISSSEATSILPCADLSPALRRHEACSYQTRGLFIANLGSLMTRPEVCIRHTLGIPKGPFKEMETDEDLLLS